jgi:hypothetical protein
LNKRQKERNFSKRYFVTLWVRILTRFLRTSQKSPPSKQNKLSFPVSLLVSWTVVNNIYTAELSSSHSKMAAMFTLLGEGGGRAEVAPEKMGCALQHKYL